VFRLSTLVWAVIVFFTCILSLVVGIFIGQFIRKKFAEATIGSAEREAENIKLEAMREAEVNKNKIILEAKEESIKTKKEAEKEYKERKSELQRQEKRLQQKEDAQDKKSEALDNREQQLQKKLESAGSELDKLVGVRTRAINKSLESVSMLEEPTDTLTIEE